MRLDRLRVRRLPGLDAFTLEFAPGLNILLGPNAAGKSSVARAVRRLLWPVAGDRSELTAEWTDSRGEATARVDAAGVVWSRSDRPEAPPPVPAGHLADCFELGAVDLLADGGAPLNRRLAVEIRRAMTGGIDLDGMAEQLSLPRKNDATALEKRWTGADVEARNVAHGQEALASRREGLAELARRRDRARSARERYEALRTAADLRTAERELAEATETLARFPAVMEAVGADDDERAAALLRACTGAEDQVAKNEAARRRLVGEIAQLGLPADFDSHVDPARYLAVADACREAAGEAERAAANLAGAEAAWREAANRLGAEGAELDDAPDDRVIERAAEIHRRMLEAEARLAALGEAAAPDGRPWPAFVPWIAVLAGVVLMALGSPFVGLPAGAAGPGLVAGVLLIAGGLLAQARSIRKRLESERAGLREAERAAAEADAAAAREDARVVAERWGLGERLDNVGWLRDLERLRDADRRRRDLTAARAASERTDGNAAARLAAFNEEITQLGADPATDVRRVGAAVEELDRRLHRHRDLMDRLAGQDEAVRHSKAGVATARTELERFCDRLNLDPASDVPGLAAALVERRAAWQESVAAAALRRSECERLSALSGAHREAGLLPADLPDDDTLAGMIREEQAAAEALVALSEEVAALETEIRAAGAGYALAAAQAEAARRRDDFRQWQGEARERVIERALLDQLQREYEELAAPPQLTVARELFARFTRDAYSVSVVTAADGPEFVVDDEIGGARLALDQLSDGTRCQLLLAVRLAFLRQAEAGDPLPLFLDESLTTTDGERTRAIVQALGRLAADEKRQIIYLTSNPADVSGWRAALNGTGLPEPNLVDLGQARRMASAAVPADLAPDVEEIPEPDGRDAAGYGAALGVARFVPADGWQAADTFHLAAPDLELVRRLRVLGLRHAGQLAGFLAAGDRRGLLGEPAAAHLESALDVLRAFTAAWSVGRPRPVRPGDIVDSEAITETMRPRVLELLERVAGDGQRLLAALEAGEVPRFLSRAREALAGELTDAGALDDRPSLDGDDLVATVQARTAHLQREARTSPGEVRALVLRLAAAASRRPSSG